MAECSYSSCIQEKRAIKRELQKWTKDLVYLVGKCSQFFLADLIFFFNCSSMSFWFYFLGLFTPGWTLGFGPPVSLYHTLVLAVV